MFDAVARRYDITNTVLSGGQDKLWRRASRKMLAPQQGDRILDLAAGTGVSTVELSKSGAWCVATDFSMGMLKAGKSRGVPMVGGDALHLPFADAVFDGALISFGLRNLVDTKAGLAEIRRVTKPGGRLVVCEFSTPVRKPFKTVYMEYLMKALPAVARRVSSNPDAYVYLAESIRAWPDQPALAAIMESAGWTDVHLAQPDRRSRRTAQGHRRLTRERPEEGNRGIAFALSLAALAACESDFGDVARPSAAATERASVSGLELCHLSALPDEAQTTMRQIERGGPFPYPDKDGSVFGNFERILPSHERGYYREYTVPTPGSRNRGAQRIVTGGTPLIDPPDAFYTADHYDTFCEIEGR